MHKPIPVAALLLIATPAFAQDQPDALPPQTATVPEDASTTQSDLAAKLADPVASMISVPFQHTIDCCYGERDAVRYTLNFQPVIPVKLNDKADLIVRTIVPFVAAQPLTYDTKTNAGFGDVVQTFFFKPKTRGFTFAAGPVFLWPTGETQFGSGKWGAGPSALVLKQTPNGLTIGMLANHIWSYAGKEDRDDFSSTLLQPFFTKTFKDSTSITLNTETNYDWVHKQWTVPLNLSVATLTHMGKLPLQVAATGRYYAERPVNGPEWGVRLTFTFLFPKK